MQMGANMILYLLLCDWAYSECWCNIDIGNLPMHHQIKAFLTNVASLRHLYDVLASAILDRTATDSMQVRLQICQ